MFNTLGFQVVEFPKVLIWPNESAQVERGASSQPDEVREYEGQGPEYDSQAQNGV